MSYLDRLWVVVLASLAGAEESQKMPLWAHYVGATIGLFIFIGIVYGVRRFRAWRAYEQMRKEYGKHWGKSIFHSDNP